MGKKMNHQLLGLLLGMAEDAVQRNPSLLDSMRQVNPGHAKAIDALEELLVSSEKKPKGFPLTERLEILLRQAVKQTGSFDPDEALPVVEEMMTLEECRHAEGFLNWCGKNKRTFGHNIGEVWAEYQSQK